jgi:hypothetical protein
MSDDILDYPADFFAVKKEGSEGKLSADEAVVEHLIPFDDHSGGRDNEGGEPLEGEMEGGKDTAGYVCFVCGISGAGCWTDASAAPTWRRCVAHQQVDEPIV